MRIGTLKRTFAIELQNSLIESADIRCRFTGRTRNRELCHLLSIGFQEVSKSGREAALKQSTYSRTSLWVEEELLDKIIERAKLNERPTGKEVNVLIQTAITRIRDRDLAIIQHAQSAGSGDPASSQTAAPESQPATPA